MFDDFWINWENKERENDEIFLFTARFGKISTMRADVRKIGVEKSSDQRLQTVNIVFITLNNAVDLLQ